MPNANYKKGRRTEYLVRKILAEEGFSSTRAAGSKGVYDIIAWSSEYPRVRFIQVKKGAKASLQERLKIGSDPMGGYGEKELWEFEDGNTEPKITKFKPDPKGTKP